MAELQVVARKKSPRRPRDWEPLITECVVLMENGHAKSWNEAAWLVARTHAAEGVNYATLANYLSLWRRIDVETPNMVKANQALNLLTLDELQSLPTQDLSKFAALCAHWADLGKRELDKRVQQQSHVTSQNQRTPGGWRLTKSKTSEGGA